MANMMYDAPNQDEILGDPYANSQFEQTQQASQSQDVVEVWDDRYWGVLKPMHNSHSRINLSKDKKTVTIGRGSENDIKLANLKISNKHCKLIWDGNETVTVQDLSTNGTWVNGCKLGRNNSALLQDGYDISFGQYSEASSPDNYRYIFRFMANGAMRGGVHKYYDIGSVIGRGSFAVVRRGVCRADGQTVAIKMINRNKLRADGQGTTSIFLKEVDILNKLHHPNICQLKDVFHETDSVIIILEYIDGGDLLDYIISRDGLTEDEARRLAFQLFKALKYIHNKGIAHRDLKPENILLTRDDPPVLKIADFGLAKAVDSCTGFKTMCGTPIYLAPEVILREAHDGYHMIVDSWSAGVIVFAMIANANPFVDDDASVMAIRFRSRYIDWNLIESKNISLDCCKFLKRLLDENPSERMSCTDALKHAWLASLSANDPEALDDTPNDSFVSVQANAGSFLDQEYATPLPPPPPTLPEISRPSSQELQRAGISSNFGQIRMDEASSVNASMAVSEADPTPDARQPAASSSRGQGRKLERQAMQIAERDENGIAGSFHAVPPSPVDPGPGSGENANGNGHNVDREGSPSSTNGQNAEAAGDAQNGHSDADGNEEDAASEPGLSPVTEDGNAIAESSHSHSTNTRKRSAPAQEPRDADMHEAAPSKRSRAIPADVAA